MKWLKQALVWWVVGATTVMALLYFAQEKLIFYPQPLNLSNAERLMRVNGVEALDIQTGSEATKEHLRGWLRYSASHSAKASQEPRNYVIYFGGNADEVSSMALEPRLPTDANWVFVNYRGYGASDGAPSELALFQDALAIYDYLRNTKGANAQHISLIGRSLGTGLAVYLASQRPVAKLLLITPYDSITSVAQGHFPWLPVSWLLKHPFDSLTRAQTMRTPVTFIVAKHDRTIPPAHAKTLYEAWAGSKLWYELESDHNGIFSHVQTWTAVREFLN